MTEFKPLDSQKLSGLQDSFNARSENRLAMNAVTSSGINKAAKNYNRARLLQRRFSTIVDNGPATNQKRSGRCWLFSSLNVARFVAKTMRCITTSWNVSTTSFRMSEGL